MLQGVYILKQVFGKDWVIRVSIKGDEERGLKNSYPLKEMRKVIPNPINI